MRIGPFLPRKIQRKRLEKADVIEIQPVSFLPEFDWKFQCWILSERKSSRF
jgi:hypothetical protein